MKLIKPLGSGTNKHRRRCVVWRRAPYWWVGLLVFFFALPNYAQEHGAGDAAHFLRAGLGARAYGLGGAFVALADDATAVYWNPAGLVQTSSFRFEGTYESRSGGLVDFQYISGTISWESLGIGALWLHSDIYSVYFFSIAGKLGDLRWGITGKLYAFSATLQSAHGLGADLGVLYRLDLREGELSIALSMSDIGWSRIHWYGSLEATDYVAWVSRLGIAYFSQWEIWKLITTVSLEAALKRPPLPDEQDYLAKALQAEFRAGAEVRMGFLRLRAGLRDLSFESPWGLSACPALGFGIRTGVFSFDVAWVSSPLGDTYVVSTEVEM